MDRRTLLKRGGLLSTVALAGCSGQSDDAGSGDGGGQDTTAGGDSGGSDGAMTETSMTEAEPGGTLRLGAAEKLPPILDMRKAADSGIYTYQVLGNLIALDRRGRIKPHLATDWSFENDGTELVFDLREGVTFHDGSKFNAEWAKWFFTDFLANGSGTSYIVKNVEGVDVEDTHRARVNFKSPDPYILWDLGSAWGTIHSRKAVEKYGKDYGKGGKVVSTGPFKEVERSGTSATLERNEAWDWPRPWQKELYDVDVEVRPKELVYDVFTETATRTSALEAGDVDGLIRSTPYSKFPKYKQSSDLKTGTAPVTTEQMFAMLNLDPETSTAPVLAEDLALRKGISYAIDRQEIVDVIFNGAAEPAPNYLVPTVAPHDVPEKYNYTFDLDQAKQVMRENGWTVNPGGVSTKNGREASFTMLVQNKSLSRKRSVLWKQHLKKIGVKVQISQVDIATFKEKVGNSNFAAALSSFYNWGNADQLWWANSKSAEDSYYFNSNSWKQFPKVTELVDAATNASTLKERTKRFKEAHIYLLENVVPNVYSVYPKRPDAWATHVNNWKPHYLGAPMWPVSSENW